MRIASTKIVSFVMAVANAGVWSALAALGFRGLQGISDQHAPGFPNGNQIIFYMIVPLVMAIISISYPLLILIIGRKNLGIRLSILMILSTIMYPFLYGGGV
jgi:hypothetical protein